MGDDITEQSEQALWILAEWFSGIYQKEGWKWVGEIPDASEIVRTLRELKDSLGNNPYKYIETGRLRVSKNKNGTYEVILIAANVDEVSIPDENE